MVKRTVQFTVKADGGVTPAIPLFGGIKGEHNATVLSVTFDSGVYNGETVRLSFTTGDGTVLSSDLIEEIVVDGDKASFTYPLPRLLTIAAGQLCMRVVLTMLDEHGAETECRHSDEMVLYFDHADVENGTPFWTGVSEMLTRTTTAKDAAVAAARDANIEAIKACVSASDAQGFADDAEASAAEATAARDAIEPVKNMANEAFKYKGKVATGAVLAAKPDAKYRDVWFVENEKCFYMYDGKDWIPFGSGSGGGANGITPHIGANGNWFIGDEDTGVKAQGTSGVYVGSGDMPDDCNLKINPNGIASIYNPDAKTDAMTLPVGVDKNGKLWAPGGNGGDIPTGGGEWRLARTITLEQDVSSIAISADDDGKPLNCKEAFIEWVNPPATTNCACYMTIFGDKNNIPKTALGIIAASGKTQYTLWSMSRIADKLLVETIGEAGVSIGAKKSAYPKLYDIGNITKIQLNTDGGARYFMMTGAVLRLYVKGE